MPKSTVFVLLALICAGEALIVPMAVFSATSKPAAKMGVRPVVKEDLVALKSIVDENELFPSEMLDEMTSDYLTNAETKEIWLTSDAEGGPHSVAFCAPEKMTEGTWNLYLIAVQPSSHSKGIGSEMMEHLESLLVAKGGRVLLVETSGLPEYERTRGFYLKRGFTQEAIIRDFYQEGEDKVVFWKKLKK